MGFLTAWLELGTEVGREAHWDKEIWKTRLTHGVRTLAREKFKESGGEKARYIVDRERPRRHDVEHDEPRNLLGYL